MLHTPFYNPKLSYEKNYENGPFGAFSDGKKESINFPIKQTFCGIPIRLPFGIASGPLLNARFVKSALDKGFDLPVYKTVRTIKKACHQYPNVLPVSTKSILTIEDAQKGLITKENYDEPLAITNSFGVPSFDPEIWQKDLADAVSYAENGQIVIGSFQGTSKQNGDIDSYINDFVLCAKMVKETGCKILEANLSCPNEGTSNLLCFDTERVRKIAVAIKNEIGDTPLLLKCAYYIDQIHLEDFVKKLNEIVQGFCAINTISAKVFDENGNQALPGDGRLFSGVCGSPIRWAGVDMVKRLNKIREENNYSYEIVGVGGVSSQNDFKEYKNAGADIVMCATGAMWNPYLAKEISEIK